MKVSDNKLLNIIQVLSDYGGLKSIPQYLWPLGTLECHFI
jgi:hypothetical protein